MLKHSDAVEELLAPPDIHDSSRESIVGLPIFMVVSLVLSVGHALNLFWLIAKGNGAFLFIIIHAVLLFITYLYAKAQKMAGGDTRYAYLLFVMSAVVGVIGSLGAFLSALLSIFFYRLALPFKEWFYSIFPFRDSTLPEQINDDLVLGRDENAKNYSVMPFLDVMAVGSEKQKRVALARMTTMFDPIFAPAFKKALEDPSNTIRVQAATAINKIEGIFHDHLVTLQALVKKHPRNAVVKKALADHYDAYAFTGLLDPYREVQNRERAREHYVEYLALQPNDADARLKVGRLLVRGGHYTEGADWLKSSMDQGFSNHNMKVWYLECLYHSGQYARLRDAVMNTPMDLNTLQAEQPALAEAINLWSGGRRAPTANQGA